MTRRLPSAAGLLIAASSLGLAACSSNPSSTDVVKVAVEGPMTGPQSSTGLDMWRGANLMATTINNAGGILGKQLKLIRVDDKADATTGMAKARLTVSKHVEAVIGPYNSAVGLENLPIYLHAGVVVVRLTSNQKTNGMGITLQPMDYQVAPFEAAAVEKMAGSQRVAIVYDTSAYTSGVAAEMKTLLGSAGVPVVAFESFTSTETQFRDMLNAVTASKPTVVYYAAYDPQAENLVSQAAELGVPGTCLVDGLAAQGPTFLGSVPRALAQKCVFSGVPTASQFADAKSYVSEYKAAYHQDPGTWGVFAYDSLGVLAQEIKAVHSLSSAKVNAALFHVSGYQGATGSTTIDPATGNRMEPPLVMQVVDSTGHYVVSPDWSAHGALPVLPARTAD